ncbi:MAG: undecaprenyl-diphosphate phosphatase [Solirubrobacteraceae bacterium]
MPSRRRLSPHRPRNPRHKSASAAEPSLWEAVALGVLQGPTELLPVSSSGHTTLVPWLAGWSYAELDPELRKAFEVALHTGAGVALAIDMRAELIEATRTLDRRRIAVVALSLLPAAIAGYVLEEPIERRLGGPCSIAAGLIAGAVAMTAADLRPGPGGREAAQAGPRDGLALGLAQAAALIPGVSRNGATLTAARARGFRRADAQALSWHAALPVILGASALKGWRMWQRGIPGNIWPVLAAGAGSAFVSTTASARLMRRARVNGRGLLPYAVYRCTIAAIALARVRDAQNRNR